MPISRRLFIKSGSLAAFTATVVLSPKTLALGQSQTQGTNLGYQIPSRQQPNSRFTRQTFEPHVGSIFQAPNASGRMVSLTLLSVTTNKPSERTKISTAPARDTDSFSLMFKSAGPLPPFTSTHKVSHPALGKFDLFLTPRPQAQGAMMYEAVFNHI